MGNAYLNSKLVADNLYNGSNWEIGLRRYYPEVVEKGLDLHIVPIKKGKEVTSVSVAAVSREFVGTEIKDIKSIEVVLEYKLVLGKK